MSQRQRIALQPAWVLHQFDYRDSSRIVEFLTRDHGRIAAVARGVRRANSRQRGLLQAFQPLLLSWSGRELGTVTGLEAAGAPFALTGEALLAGFYLNELCLRLTAVHDPHPEILALYAQLLGTLAQGDDVAAVLRRFELGLLDALGYGLTLAVEPRNGAAVEPDGWYVFHVDSGPERVTRTSNAAAVSGASLLAMAASEFDKSAVRRDAQRILRAAIDRLLGERPLKSRDVLREMSRKVRGEG